MEKRINLICERRLEKYFGISEKAMKIAEGKINFEKKKEADEILNMARCYISDAKYFRKKSDFVNAFAAINYAHGWLDCGARLGIFKVKDTKLFTVE